MVHEQNAVLGKANRLVLGGVSKVATSFARTRFVDDDRARLVGNPVRETVRALRSAVYRAPGPDRVIDLLVFGGSQGAASFSQVIPEAILSLPAPMRARLRIVQQCRPEDLERVRALYLQANIVAELAPFFADLPQRLAGAHLVIGRSGASTVAELATDRAAVDPHPLSLRRRRSPDRQCPRLRGGRRLPRDSARRLHRADAGRPSARAVRGAAAPGRRWPPPRTPPAGPTPRHGSPISSAS